MGTKISELTASTVPVRTAALPAVEDATTKQYTVAQILGLVVPDDIEGFDDAVDARLSGYALTTTVNTALGLKADASALGTAAAKDVGTSAGQVPVLATGGKLDTAVLPALSLVETSVVASQVAMLALTAQPGDVAVRTDLNKTFILTASPASSLANWQELLTPTDVVTSVAGKTGAVTLTNSDVSGLGTAATKNTGTSAGNVVELGVGGALPAVSGANLTNLPSSGASTTAANTWTLTQTFSVSPILTNDQPLKQYLADGINPRRLIGLDSANNLFIGQGAPATKMDATSLDVSGPDGVTNWITSGQSGTAVFHGIAQRKGESTITRIADELVTLSTSGTTTDTSANLLPANCVILAVTAYVETAITGASDWKLGDASTAARFSAASSTLSVGAQAVGMAQWATGAQVQTSAAKVRITTTGTPTTGKIRVAVHYIQLGAPTQ